jgi:hypothetical protein
MDALWSVTKSVTKLSQRHSVWTSHRASYLALWIYDEIWQFVMYAVWSMTKSENVMWISSWITRFFVVLTWLLLNLWIFIHEIHHLLKFPNKGSSRLSNIASSWSPEFRQFPIIHLLKFPNRGSSRLLNFAGPWSHEFRQFPIIPKQTTDSRTNAKFGYYFRIFLESQRNV